MTDLAVNNRKMRIDLASQVFNHTIIDQQFDVVFLKAGKGAGGGGGGFGDREGRGRREEDPDAGRFASTIHWLSVLNQNLQV